MVASGAPESSPTDGSYFHGVDGLGDVPSDSPGFVELDEHFCTITSLDAVDEFIRLLTEASASGDDVILVTLGPLTNLATFLERSSGSEVSKALSQCFVMGGCANGRGNATRSSEFNVYMDPEAAARSFAALQSPEWEHCATTVISWDLCTQHPLPWHIFQHLVYDDGEAGGKLRDFVAAIARKPFPPAEAREGDVDAKRGSGAVVCDLLAVAVALYPELALSAELTHVDVETGGRHTRGTTVVDFGHCYDKVLRLKRIRWVTSVDVERYSQLFASLFTSGHEFTH